jgi:hypothetical protein
LGVLITALLQSAAGNCRKRRTNALPRLRMGMNLTCRWFIRLSSS